MSSEPSERAKAWAAEYLYNEFGERPASKRMALAYDAGHAEGEEKGAAVGYLKALREAHEMINRRSLPYPDGAEGYVSDFDRAKACLDRRIREAEENAK